MEERIVGRLERQAILTERKPPVALSFVIHEAALRSPLADAEHLRHLLETRDHERFAYTEGQLGSRLSAARSRAVSSPQVSPELEPRDPSSSHGFPRLWERLENQPNQPSLYVS